MHPGPPIKPPRIDESGEQYRVYFFNVAHITQSHEFFADSDEAAIRIAEAWREGREMELWCRDRKVKAWR